MSGSPYQFRGPLAIAGALVFLFSLIGARARAAAVDIVPDGAGIDAAVFSVQPETANLVMTRNDFSLGGAAVITRSFRRDAKQPGLFGAGWCSNLDLSLNGTEEATPTRLELVDCQNGRTRAFRKLLEVWIEDTSGSRVLRTVEGKWQMTDAPFAVFRPDGKLESFVGANQVRWHVRRDSLKNIDSIDNLKDRPIKIRRNASGDVEAILDGRGRVVAKYHLTTVLQSVESNGVSESYEYDSDMNVLKLMRNQAGQISRLWRFSYTATQWVSSVNHPDGCVSKWIFDRQVSPYLAKESKTCREETLETPKPVVATGTSKRDLASAAVPTLKGPIQPTAATVLTRPGALGVGTEKAAVTVNRDGLPILFEVLGTNGQVRRIEIVREEGSGSALSVRSGKAQVNFNKKPRAYDEAQLDLLDDYETWVSAWGSR